MQTLQLLHNLFTGALVCISQKVSVAAYFIVCTMQDGACI